MVSFTSRPLYPLGKSCRYSLNRGLGKPQSGLDTLEKRTEDNDTHKQKEKRRMMRLSLCFDCGSQGLKVMQKTRLPMFHV
jgi:hypothetical protein